MKFLFLIPTLLSSVFFLGCSEYLSSRQQRSATCANSLISILDGISTLEETESPCFTCTGVFSSGMESSSSTNYSLLSTIPYSFGGTTTSADYSFDINPVSTNPF